MRAHFSWLLAATLVGCGGRILITEVSGGDGDQVGGGGGGGGGGDREQIAPVCGNGLVEAGEECEGADTGTTTCVDRGFDGGLLGCNGCRFDTSACSLCGDGVLGSDEECDGNELGGALCLDYGFGAGVPGCDDTCRLDISACPRCGNGIREPAEICDGGDLAGLSCEQLISPAGTPFHSGRLSCDGFYCIYDTAACAWCGDGVVNGTEECERTQLGGVTCQSLGYEAGTLRCTAGCTFDRAVCSRCGDGVASGPEWCDGTDTRGATCESRQLVGGTLACMPGCMSFDTSDCGMARLEIRPSLSAITVLAGDTASQAFEAWAIFNDGTERAVAPQWYTTNDAAGTLTPAGLFTTSSTLTASVSTTLVAAWAGRTGALTFTVRVIEVVESCGDRVRQDPEECDFDDFGTASCATRGFSGGSLSCSSACMIDDSGCTRASCGNSTIDAGEDCDCGGDGCTAAELGNETCATVGNFSGGALGCRSNCAFDTGACTTGSVDPLAGLTQLDLLFDLSRATRCGNGICEAGETAAVCAGDCRTALCGDGACGLDESEQTCAGAGGDCAGIVRVAYAANGAPAIELVAIGTFPNGQRDVTSLVTWDVAGDAIGTFDPFSGTFNPNGASGTVVLTAAGGADETDCTGTDVCASLTVEVVIDAEFVATPEPDAPLPRAVPSDPARLFTDAAGADLCPGASCVTGPAADMPFIVYPHDEVLLPLNVYQLLFQWNRGYTNNQTTYTLFRVRLENAATRTDVSIYTTADRWRPSSEIWRFVSASNAGGSVELSVEAVKAVCDASGCTSDGRVYRSPNSITIRLSRADVPGAIYYWSTAVEGVKKGSVTSKDPINFYWPTGVATAPPGGGVGSRYADFRNPTYVPDPDLGCVGCHGMSRDGTRLAVTNKNELNVVDTTGEIAARVAAEPLEPSHVRELAHVLAYAGEPFGPDQAVVTADSLEFPTFSPDSRFVVGGKGSLMMVSASTGRTLGRNPIPLPSIGGRTNGMHADWSPDGFWLAFAASGRGVGVLTYDRDAPSPPAPGDATDQHWGGGLALVNPTPTGYYPSFSPNSLWLVFNSGGEKNDNASLLHVLEWAVCDPLVPHPPNCSPSDAVCECRPIPRCRAASETRTTLTLPWRARMTPAGPALDIAALPACTPRPLTRLNSAYNNCDRYSGAPPAAGYCGNSNWQHNMARWAPTNRPDAFFLVFTSHRPYGKVSAGATDDQLWVAGFDQELARTSGDGSFPAFWLPFQFLSETNHRAYWTHDPGAVFESCGAEVCDGLDNDCDGLVDDGCCVPETEVCDSRDNDCDGLVDERDALGGPVEGALCCAQTAEVCDGVDNDCDGQVDEGCSGCIPSAEVCDNRDNDCDGLVDADDPDIQPNSGSPDPVACPCWGPEVCDGRDNDCDGAIDDADTSVALPAGRTCCFPFSSDPCNGVDDDCDGTRDNGCCIPDVPPNEVCDYRDNDCDLLVDEADPDLGPGACCQDVDRDGYTNCDGDCNDALPNINPSIQERDDVDCQLCQNGIDENCDGSDCLCSGG